MIKIGAMRMVLLTLLLSLTLLVACAPAATPEEPTASPLPPSSAATATTSAPAAATISPTDSATSSVQPSAVVYGRTEEGAYFHGAADAPVTLTDYSDFL